MSILVVGSIALDTIKTPFGSAEGVLGGSATYFSYAASFFSEVRLVAVVGEDFPKPHLELLKRRGIGLDGLQVAPNGKTFRWSGLYETDMNAAKTLKTDLNVLADFHPKIPAHYASTPHVFLANVDPDVQMELLNSVERPSLVGCDTMNLWISIKADSLSRLLKKVDVFLLNDGEARQLTGITNLIKAAVDLRKRGPKIVVIKKGEHGAILATKDFLFVVPAYPVEDVFDPTGAGDCFAGGFFSSLVTSGRLFDETTLRRAVIFGTVMASFNVESFSLERLKTLNNAQILERYGQFKKLTHFDPADHTTSFKPAVVSST
ncbi:MAG: sugar kinase [Elusimicrobia bacterium]|nr:sugar kinase [Elusimicrobiota bacterium]